MFTGIWQFRTPGEFDWMNEIFGEFISEYVWDCKREVAPDNSILFDSYICDSDPAYFRRFRGKNAFLVHVYDETFDGLYEETYSNFRGVFRFFWSDVFNPERVFKLPLGYCKGFASDGGPLKPATERRYLWSFVGDAATQCSSSCMEQTTSPNGDAGADGMVSVLAHELEEAVTDPDLNAWYDRRGAENADKCAWTFGATYTTNNGSLANMKLGQRDFLIQQNWVNAAGGYCALRY